MHWWSLNWYENIALVKAWSDILVRSLVDAGVKCGPVIAACCCDCTGPASSASLLLLQPCWTLSLSWLTPPARAVLVSAYCSTQLSPLQRNWWLKNNSCDRKRWKGEQNCLIKTNSSKWLTLLWSNVNIVLCLY